MFDKSCGNPNVIIKVNVFQMWFGGSDGNCVCQIMKHHTILEYILSRESVSMQ